MVSPQALDGCFPVVVEGSGEPFQPHELVRFSRMPFCRVVRAWARFGFRGHLNPVVAVVEPPFINAGYIVNLEI